MRDVVGVIGLGAMGAPMAANLDRAGYEVASYDTRGDGSSGSVAEVAACATRAVIVVVRTRPQVEEVVAQLDRAGLDVLIMSTIDPSTMAHLAQDLARRGLTAVDAPVSGGVAGAEAGTLAIMVAGDPAAVERCRPLLEVMGRSILVIGDRPGMGQAVKLANQLMLTVSLLAVQEGLRLAGEYGLQPEDVLPVIERSTGASWGRRQLGDGAELVARLPAWRGAGRHRQGHALSARLRRRATRAAARGRAGIPAPARRLALTAAGALSR